MTRLAPVPVRGLTQVGGISAGLAHNVAVKTDGTAVAWGWNDYGQLGSGTAMTATSPVPVLGLGRAEVVSAGALHSIAAGVPP